MYANNDYYNKQEESLDEIMTLKKWDELYNLSYQHFVNYKVIPIIIVLAILCTGIVNEVITFIDLDELYKNFGRIHDR